MKIEVNVINAFSVNHSGGNPAGVVFDADCLSTEHKQQIATKAGFPETAFVSKSTTAEYKLDFFTPVKQIAHCGHATIAAFSYLKTAGKIKGNKSSKETIDGKRTIVFKEEKAFMQQQAPRFIPIGNQVPNVLASLNLGEDDLKPGHQPLIVHTGNAFMIIAVKDVAILAQIQYDRELVSKIAEENQLIGFYVYTTPADDKTILATTRMFAPTYGIDEEAATGMAAGPLACYLYVFEKDTPEHLKIEQGRYMDPPSPSIIEVRLKVEDYKILELFAGGNAYISGKKLLEI